MPAQLVMSLTQRSSVSSRAVCGVWIRDSVSGQVHRYLPAVLVQEKNLHVSEVFLCSSSTVNRKPFAFA